MEANTIISAWLLVLLVHAASPQASEDSGGFVANEVVPDIISVPPATTLSVTFPSGAKADNGAELTPTQVKDAPALTWQSEAGALYTVIMIDADPPSRANPRLRTWRHWLVVNVTHTNLSSGDEVTAYVGSGPPLGSGLHRYVFMVYKQPGPICVDESLRKTKNQVRGRAKWHLRRFVSKHHLGVPVAGNMYQAQYDSYVPKLYKTFTN